MKRTFIGVLLLLLLGIANKADAQNEKFKALFMYNFTKYIEWPSNMQNGEFVIGVLGNSPMKTELDIIASKKQIGTQPIKIKTFNSINDIGACHILYIPTEKSASLDEAVSKAKGKGILIITDKPGMARRGSGINYVVNGGKQDFEISKSAISAQQLKVNAALYALGNVLD